MSERPSYTSPRTVQTLALDAMNKVAAPGLTWEPWHELYWALQSIAVASEPRPSIAAKPVAWRYRLKGHDLPWKFVDKENECNPLLSYEREPLYRHPWTQPSAIEPSRYEQRYQFLRKNYSRMIIEICCGTYQRQTIEEAEGRLDKAIDGTLNGSVDGGNKEPK